MANVMKRLISEDNHWSRSADRDQFTNATLAYGKTTVYIWCADSTIIDHIAIGFGNQYVSYRPKPNEAYIGFSPEIWQNRAYDYEQQECLPYYAELILDIEQMSKKFVEIKKIAKECPINCISVVIEILKAGGVEGLSEKKELISFADIKKSLDSYTAQKAAEPAIAQPPDEVYCVYESGLRRRYSFRRVKEVRDENYAYAAFNIAREQAYGLLKASFDQIKNILKPAVEEALVEGKFISYLVKNKIVKDKKLATDLEQQAQAYVSGGKKALVINNTKVITDHSEVIGGYIDYDVLDKQVDGGWSHPCVLQALACIRRIGLYLWQEKDDHQLGPLSSSCLIDNEGKPISYHQYAPKGAAQNRHLLFIKGKGNHFACLNYLADNQKETTERENIFQNEALMPLIREEKIELDSSYPFGSTKVELLFWKTSKKYPGHVALRVQTSKGRYAYISCWPSEESHAFKATSARFHSFEEDLKMEGELPHFHLLYPRTYISLSVKRMLAAFEQIRRKQDNAAINWYLFAGCFPLFKCITRETTNCSTLTMHLLKAGGIKGYLPASGQFGSFKHLLLLCASRVFITTAIMSCGIYPLMDDNAGGEQPFVAMLEAASVTLATGLSIFLVERRLFPRKAEMGIADCFVGVFASLGFAGMALLDKWIEREDDFDRIFEQIFKNSAFARAVFHVIFLTFGTPAGLFLGGRLGSGLIGLLCAKSFRGTPYSTSPHNLEEWITYIELGLKERKEIREYIFKREMASISVLCTGWFACFALRQLGKIEALEYWFDSGPLAFYVGLPIGTTISYAFIRYYSNSLKKELVAKKIAPTANQDREIIIEQIQEEYAPNLEIYLSSVLMTVFGMMGGIVISSYVKELNKPYIEGPMSVIGGMFGFLFVIALYKLIDFVKSCHVKYEAIPIAENDGTEKTEKEGEDFVAVDIKKKETDNTSRSQIESKNTVTKENEEIWQTKPLCQLCAANRQTVVKLTTGREVSLDEIYRSIETAIAWYNNDYLDTLIARLALDVDGTEVTCYSAVRIKDLLDRIAQVKKQTAPFALWLLNTAYNDPSEIERLNHWVVLLVHKDARLIFCLDPAKGTINYIVEEIKRAFKWNAVTYFENPIDFQLAEKEDRKGMRHCGAYALEIAYCLVNSINKLSPGTEITKLEEELNNCVKTIAHGKDEDILTIREQHMEYAEKYLRSCKKSLVQQPNDGSSHNRLRMWASNSLQTARGSIQGGEIGISLTST
jgi:hypothetical protein